MVVHGGGSRPGAMAVNPTQLSVLRMVPTARRIARAGRRRIAVWRLLNSYRGWDTRHTPLDDVRWALDEIRRRHPGLPIGLAGHSLGGRAVLLAAPEPEVHSVVALAPYVLPGDLRGADLRGRRLLVVHGLADRIASPASSAALVRSLPPDVRAGYLAVRDGKHAMLARRRHFDGAAADFLRATLLGDDVDGAVADLLRGPGPPWAEV